MTFILASFLQMRCISCQSFLNVCVSSIVSSTWSKVISSTVLSSQGHGNVCQFILMSASACSPTSFVPSILVPAKLMLSFGSL